MRLAAGDQDGGRAPGGKWFPSFAWRVPVGARYAYLCPPRWAGGWRVTIGVPLSESIQVRVGVLRLGGEAAVRVRTRRVRGLGALVEWVGPQRLPRRPVGWRRIPCRRGSQKLLRRPPGGGGAHPPCARARQAAAPPRGPSATAPPGPPGPESHAPARSGRGLPPPASRENRWVGDIHLHPHPGRDPIRLATAPGLLHEESSRVRDRGTRHQPWCARRSTRRPAGARREETIFHSDLGRRTQGEVNQEHRATRQAA